MVKTKKRRAEHRAPRPDGDSFANRVAEAFSEVAGRGMGSMIASLPQMKVGVDKARDMFIASGIDPNDASNVLRNVAIFSSIFPRHEEAGELLEGFLTRASEVLRQRSGEVPRDPDQQVAWLTQTIEAERKKYLEEGNLPKVAVAWSRVVTSLSEVKRRLFFADLFTEPALLERFKKEGDSIKIDAEYLSKVVLEFPERATRLEFLRDALVRASAPPVQKRILPEVLQKPYDEMKKRIESSKGNFDVKGFTKATEKHAREQRADVDDWNSIKHGR